MKKLKINKRKRRRNRLKSCSNTKAIRTMNTTTTITLNDRFSMIKKSNGFPPQAPRGRSRSQSRNRQQAPPPSLQGSRRNRQLLDQLEKQHKMRLALKLKNVSMISCRLGVHEYSNQFFNLQKSILRSRGRVQGQIIRSGVKRAAAIKKAVNVRNLKRANNLTTFIP